MFFYKINFEMGFRDFCLIWQKAKISETHLALFTLDWNGCDEFSVSFSFNLLHSTCTMELDKLTVIKHYRSLEFFQISLIVKVLRKVHMLKVTTYKDKWMKRFWKQFIYTQFTDELPNILLAVDRTWTTHLLYYMVYYASSIYIFLQHIIPKKI